TLQTGTRLLDARRAGAQKEVAFRQDGQTIRVQAEEIFFGLGRVPNVGSLGLEKIGVKLEHGRIAANDEMQSSVPHICAAGDCTGPHEIVHIAVQQGEVAGHNVAHPARRKRMDYRLSMEVIFTEPQVAIVGLSEKEADVRGIPYLV